MGEIVEMGSAKHRWWKEAVVYQVYPASFKSTGSGNLPGWGDIKGVISKLDYFKHLGVDVVWLSPIYKSPQVDMGYDIADYKDIDPRYGTLGDVDELIAGLHKRDMKLMMDLVVNHTSDQHDWFIQSRSSKDNPKRSWYHWQPPKYDEHGNRQPPNNWAMILGEAHSAWTWDEKTQEYYLALFTPEQPDLNWENPEVRAAVHDVLRFWLERGASGFRMDVINHISKTPGYPDAPVTSPGSKYQPGHKYYANGPRLHEWLQAMNREVLSQYDTITVGEMPYVRSEEEILKVVGARRGELNMIFIFEMVDIDNDESGFRLTWRDWNSNEIKKIYNKWQSLMIDRDGWNSLFIENHDNPRSISRYCSDKDEYRELSAKLLCLMQTTLSGTLYVYQGEELGQRNMPPEFDPSEYKDVETINYWNKMKSLYPHDEEKLSFAKSIMQRKARDHARTPVQWTSESPNAGFCDATTAPWMRVNSDYKTINAEAQRSHSDGGNSLSVLQFWQRGLKQRKMHKDALVYGDFELLDPEDGNDAIFAYARRGEEEAFVTVLNFSEKDVEWEVPSNAGVRKWVAGNYVAGAPEKATKGKIVLKPWEALLGTASP